MKKVVKAQRIQSKAMQEAWEAREKQQAKQLRRAATAPTMTATLAPSQQQQQQRGHKSTPRGGNKNVLSTMPSSLASPSRSGGNAMGAGSRRTDRFAAVPQRHLPQVASAKEIVLHTSGGRSRIARRTASSRSLRRAETLASRGFGRLGRSSSGAALLKRPATTSSLRPASQSLASTPPTQRPLHPPSGGSGRAPGSSQQQLQQAQQLVIPSLFLTTSTHRLSLDGLPASPLQPLSSLHRHAPTPPPSQPGQPPDKSRAQAHTPVGFPSPTASWALDSSNPFVDVSSVQPMQEHEGSERIDAQPRGTPLPLPLPRAPPPPSSSSSASPSFPPSHPSVDTPAAPRYTTDYILARRFTSEQLIARAVPTQGEAQALQAAATPLMPRGARVRAAQHGSHPLGADATAPSPPPGSPAVQCAPGACKPSCVGHRHSSRGSSPGATLQRSARPGGGGTRGHFLYKPFHGPNKAKGHVRRQFRPSFASFAAGLPPQEHEVEAYAVLGGNNGGGSGGSAKAASAAATGGGDGGGGAQVQLLRSGSDVAAWFADGRQRERDSLSQSQSQSQSRVQSQSPAPLESLSRSPTPPQPHSTSTPHRTASGTATDTHPQQQQQQHVAVRRVSRASRVSRGSAARGRRSVSSTAGTVGSSYPLSPRSVLGGSGGGAPESSSAALPAGDTGTSDPPDGYRLGDGAATTAHRTAGTRQQLSLECAKSSGGEGPASPLQFVSFTVIQGAAAHPHDASSTAGVGVSRWGAAGSREGEHGAPQSGAPSSATLSASAPGLSKAGGGFQPPAAFPVPSSSTATAAAAPRRAQRRAASASTTRRRAAPSRAQRGEGRDTANRRGVAGASTRAHQGRPRTSGSAGPSTREPVPTARARALRFPGPHAERQPATRSLCVQGNTSSAPPMDNRHSNRRSSSSSGHRNRNNPPGGSGRVNTVGDLSSSKPRAMSARVRRQGASKRGSMQVERRPGTAHDDGRMRRPMSTFHVSFSPPVNAVATSSTFLFRAAAGLSAAQPASSTVHPSVHSTTRSTVHTRLGDGVPSPILTTGPAKSKSTRRKLRGAPTKFVVGRGGELHWLSE